MNTADIANDAEFTESSIVEVRPANGGYEIKQYNGWSFFCPDNGVEPKVGDTARFYGKGIGYAVRGLAINGAIVFYRTVEQQAAHQQMEQAERDRERRYDFERNRAAHDERIAALPRPLRERIERYQAADADFRWKYEDYELFVCEQAELIAKHVKRGDVAAFYKLNWEQQKAVVPGLSEDHSGNTFGAACSLAARLHESDEAVVAMAAAISPLVGQLGDKVGVSAAPEG